MESKTLPVSWRNVFSSVMLKPHELVLSGFQAIDPWTPRESSPSPTLYPEFYKERLQDPDKTRWQRSS